MPKSKTNHLNMSEKTHLTHLKCYFLDDNTYMGRKESPGAAHSLLDLLEDTRENLSKLANSEGHLSRKMWGLTVTQSRVESSHTGQRLLKEQRIDMIMKA